MQLNKFIPLYLPGSLSSDLKVGNIIALNHSLGISLFVKQNLKKAYNNLIQFQVLQSFIRYLMYALLPNFSLCFQLFSWLHLVIHLCSLFYSQDMNLPQILWEFLFFNDSFKNVLHQSSCSLAYIGPQNVISTCILIIYTSKIFLPSSSSTALGI